jgi:preprotein translocase subunit SecE
MHAKLRRPLTQRPRSLLLSEKRARAVAKVSPGEFIRQVRAETAKVVWPSRQETIRTMIMVLIMTGMLALFFFATDSLFSAIVQFLLGLIG